ncbi:MAG TPA: hypothetical protein VF109_03290 [Mycobacteriales bacterium]
MDEQRPQRVRVVLAGERRFRAGQAQEARREIEDQTEVGEVLVRGLIRTQLVLALRVSVLVALLFGVQPLLYALAPDLAQVAVLGLRLPWLLLGVLAYPVVVGVAWTYVRAAERNEQDFSDLVNRS